LLFPWIPLEQEQLDGGVGGDIVIARRLGTPSRNA
jgi:hypothetical protein